MAKFESPNRVGGGSPASPASASGGKLQSPVKLGSNSGGPPPVGGTFVSAAKATNKSEASGHKA